MENNNKDENIEKGLKDVLMAILDSGKKEREGSYLELADNQTVKESVELAHKKDFDGFYYKIIYPFDEFIDGLIESEISNKREIVFIFKNADYIKNLIK